MIAIHYLAEWAEMHPWQLSEQVEQDLSAILCQSAPTLSSAFVRIEIIEVVK